MDIGCDDVIMLLLLFFPSYFAIKLARFDPISTILLHLKVLKKQTNKQTNKQIKKNKQTNKKHSENADTSTSVTFCPCGVTLTFAHVQES